MQKFTIDPDGNRRNTSKSGIEIPILGQGVKGGGLMEFGTATAEQASRVGSYVDRISNGAKPGDLPVEEPTKFHLIINMKAARTMKLTIPPSLMLRADEVIE